MNGYIYAITNKTTGKRYVGQALYQTARRWYVHRHLLRQNKHHTDYLQNAWNKYGEVAFVFSVVGVVSAPEKQVLIDLLNALEERIIGNPPRGYNMQPGGGNASPTEETRSKQSAANKGRPKSEQTNAKLSAALKGQPKSEETKAKISAALKGKKTGRIPWNKGKKVPRAPGYISPLKGKKYLKRDKQQ